MVGARQRSARRRAAIIAVRCHDPRHAFELPPVAGLPARAVRGEASRAGPPWPRAIERRVTLSRDRRINTRKRNKLTIVAAAGALSVATAVSAAAAEHGPSLRQANLAVARYRQTQQAAPKAAAHETAQMSAATP